MKFPSLQEVTTGFLKTLNRFPFELFISLFGTIVAMLLIDNDFKDSGFLQRALLVSILGLALSISATLFVESNRLTAAKHIALKVSVAILLVGIYFMFKPVDQEITNIRFGLLFVGFHLLVSFSPFITSSNVHAFWEFNKQIFLRILTAALYSSVLYAGLAIAIVTTNILFNLDIDGKIYFKLWTCIFGIFNTSFFLAGVPRDWELLDREQTYPKGLKIFTQYVLIPLAFIYLCILLAYEIKIISQWSLPQGLVSWLIMGYAVYGILSVLLIFPIRNEEGNRWISSFSRWFYFLLIPLIVLLVIAIIVRVGDYGITEPRYILIVLALWLAGITIYFLSGKNNIKIIPVSLCILSLLSVWGPQSAGSISKASQMKTLVTFFEQRNSFKNGKLTKLADTVKTPKRIYSIPGYFVEHFAPSDYQDCFDINIDSLFNEGKKTNQYGVEYLVQDQIRTKLNMVLANSTDDQNYFHVNVNADTTFINGYKYMANFSYGRGRTSGPNCEFISSTETLEIKIGSGIIRFELKQLMSKISEQTGRGYSDLNKEVSVESDDKKAKLLFEGLSFQKRNGKNYLNDCSGKVLLK